MKFPRIGNSSSGARHCCADFARAMPLETGSKGCKSLPFAAVPSNQIDWRVASRTRARAGNGVQYNESKARRPA